VTRVHCGGRLRIALAASLILVGVSLQACRSATGPGRRIAEDAPADLTFEQDGERLVLVQGDVYRVRPNGGREFLERLYDPDFFAKNYRQRDGDVFQLDPETGRLYAVTRRFEDNFENAASAADLITPARWHLSNTDPERAGKADNYYDLGNRITLSRTVVRGGAASLKFHARPSSRMTSKASLVKNIMYFKKGDDVYVSGWFFIEDTPSIYDAGGMTLVDLESSFMQSVGLRIIFRQNDALAFELELPKTQFMQDSGSEVRFPTDRWVHVEAHAFLSDQAGRVEIWQDGRKVLDKQGRTLPLADTVYDRFEVGVSAIARGSRYEKSLYVDDIVISDSPIR
jgi:hypothetical protein